MNDLIDFYGNISMLSKNFITISAVVLELCFKQTKKQID